ncbi:MAG: zinc-binding alcohol dehydrogenase/oxidoreductase [Mucilaginibacter sp.]|nr:zinc-binding alcohol dehydrogenase/oxidoreductase [Mucilaginibacter sp.]
MGDGFAKFPEICNPGGRIVFFGGTAGGVPALDGRKIFWKQLQILGTTMGTTEEFKAMADFLEQHKVIPVIDEIFPLTEAQKAVDKMANSSQFGKIVLQA